MRMNHTQQIIQDAIEGGWVPDGVRSNIWKTDPDYFTGVTGLSFRSKNKLNVSTFVAIEHMLLDPSFWQAVGKTREWGDYEEITDSGIWKNTWLNMWHQFINHRADEDTYEEALAKLS